jgi:hypothetical protein
MVTRVRELSVWWKSLKGGGRTTVRIETLVVLPLSTRVVRVGASGVDLQPASRLNAARSMSAEGATLYQRGVKSHEPMRARKKGSKPDL